jgi:hypothetical protein
MIDHLPDSDLILKLYAFDIFLFGLPPLKRPKLFPPTPSVLQIVLPCTSPGVRPYTLGVTDCTILHLSQC